MKTQILLDGQGYTGFVELLVTRSLFNASGSFKLRASPQNSIIQGANFLDYPLQLQRQCTIIIGDTPVLTGYCEDVELIRNSSQFYVEITGRDRTMDLIDSTLDARTVAEFTGNTTLKQIAEKVIKSLGIKNVAVIEEVKTRKFTKGDLIMFQQGESAFSFIEKYAKKVNVLLTTDGRGNLVITNGTTDSATTSITKDIIVDDTLMLSTRNQYNTYTCYAQVSRAADLQEVDDNTVAGNSNVGTAINSAIRTGRQLIFISDTPLLPNDAKNRAIWESNFRQAMGFRYQVTVQGFTYDGINIWQPNIAVNVDDPFTGIKSTLIVQTVAFSESAEGTSTTLILVPPTAFQLKLQQDYRQSLANEGAFPFAGVG